MLEAVIFDMDGVIIDSEPFHLKVNVEIFKELDLEISDSEYNEFIGVSNSQMWTVLKNRHGLAQSSASLVARQVKGNAEYLRQNDESPISGVRELMDNLQSEGILMAVASSSPIQLIDLVLKNFDLHDKFSVIVSGEDMDRGKPAPDIFLTTSEKLGVSPGDCLVIEDSMHGVQAARAAGMKCVGFKNKNSGDQDLSLADYITDSFNNLEVDLLRRMFEPGATTIFHDND